MACTCTVIIQYSGCDNIATLLKKLIQFGLCHRFRKSTNVQVSTLNRFTAWPCKRNLHHRATKKICNRLVSTRLIKASISLRKLPNDVAIKQPLFSAQFQIGQVVWLLHHIVCQALIYYECTVLSNKPVACSVRIRDEIISPTLLNSVSRSSCVIVLGIPEM